MEGHVFCKISVVGVWRGMLSVKFLWLGVWKGMLPVIYYRSNKYSLVSVELCKDDKTVTEFR